MTSSTLWTVLAPRRSEPLLALTVAAVALIAAGLGFLTVRYEGEYGLGIFLPAAVVAALAVWTIRSEHVRSWDAFSPLGLSCIFYLATFSIGALYAAVDLDHPLRHVYSVEGMAQAMWVGALGLGGLIVGYRANLFRFVTALVPALPRVNSHQAGAVMIAVAVIGWAARGVVFATGSYFYAYDNEGAAATATPGVVIMLAILPTLVVAYCGARYNIAKRSGENDPVMRRWFLILMTIEVAYHAPRGTRAAFLTLIMMVLVLRYYGLHKRPSLKATVAFILVGMIVVFPVLFSLRNEGQGSQAYEQNLGYAAQSAVDGLVAQSPTDALDAGFTSTFDRFSGATSLGAVFQCACPPPRDPGVTLSWVATSVLPSSVLGSTDRPERFGYEFGRYYGISDYSGIALTQVGEMWLNYEWLGVFFGLVLVGGVYRVIGDYYGRRSDDPLALAIYATVAWAIVNTQETVVAAGVVGILKQLVIFTVLLYGLTWLLVAAPSRLRSRAA